MTARAPEESMLSTSPSDVDAKTPSPPTPGHIAMMPPRTPSSTMFHWAAIVAHEERGVGAVWAQPRVWAAESDTEVNGPAIAFRNG